MNITTSGIHYFTSQFPTGRKVIIDLAGTELQFNSATVTFGYKAIDGEFSPFLNTDGSAITTTSRGGFECAVPRSKEVGINISATPGTGGLTMDVYRSWQ